MSEPYKLPPKLDLPAATPLAQDLKSRLDGDLVLDASEMTQIGALCTQVIASAALSLHRAGHSARIIHMTDRVVEQLGHLGFSPESLTEVAE